MADCDCDKIKPGDACDSGSRLGPSTGLPPKEMNNQSRSVKMPKRDYSPEVKGG